MYLLGTGKSALTAVNPVKGEKGRQGKNCGCCPALLPPPPHHGVDARRRVRGGRVTHFQRTGSLHIKKVSRELRNPELRRVSSKLECC
jgi:hypothetical protein